MEFEVGAKVGAYEIIDVISSSRTEVAYRVRNTQKHRVEVMRVLPLAMAGDQDTTERFLREMRVHAQLSHPNILVFFATMQLERRLVMTTEFVEGVTLAERLESGPLPWEEAVALASQVLSALGHAHARGIVHRDVTPKNIIITLEGGVKLTDFGLAKATGSPQLTQLGTIVGTLGYMSPEQVRGTSAVDARSDLYSLALVLYEAVAGKVPFDYRSQFDIMSAQVSETPKSPSALNQSVPAELDALILKAAAKAPADRFQSAEEFQAALDELVRAAEEAVSVPSAGVVDAEAVEPAPTQTVTAAESETAVSTALPAVAATAEMPGIVPAPAAVVSIPPEPLAVISEEAASPEPEVPAAAVAEPAAGAARLAVPEAPAATFRLFRISDVPAPLPEPAPAAGFQMPTDAVALPVKVPAPVVPDVMPAVAIAVFTELAAMEAASGSDAMPAAAIPDAPAPGAEPTPAAAAIEPPGLPEAVTAAVPAPSVPDEIPAVAVAAFAELAAMEAADAISAASDAMPPAEIPDTPAHGAEPAPLAAVIEPPGLPEAVAAAVPAPSVPDEVPAAVAAAAPAELPIAAESALSEIASDAAGAAAELSNGTEHDGDPASLCASDALPAASEASPAAVLESMPVATAVALETATAAAAVTVPAAANGTQTGIDTVPDAAPAAPPPPPVLLSELPTLLVLAPPSAPAAPPAPAEAPVLAGAADREAPGVPAPAPLPYAEAPAMEEPPAAAPAVLSEAVEPFPDVPVEAAGAPQALADLPGAAAAATPEMPAEFPAEELVQIENGDKPDEPGGFFADPTSPAWDGGKVLLYAATMSLLAVVIALVLTR